MHEKKVGTEERIDSATEMKALAQLPELRPRPEARHRSSAPVGAADFLGMGAGHDELGSAASRHGDDGGVADDLLAGI